MENHYYTTKLVKMGKWALLPLDCDTWHTEECSKYSQETFGFYKGCLVINTKDGGQHAYMPESFFTMLYKYIKEQTGKNFRAIEKKLKEFYPLKEKAKKVIPKINPKDLSKISNKELIAVYRKNRDWAHRITVYDQFGWLGEEYWTPIMRDILTRQLGLKWDEKWYEAHLEEVSSKKLPILKKEYEVLEKYSTSRNQDIKEIIKKYKIDKKELQVFVDFGLALDARNEAEYIVSLCGFHLLPVYNEIAKRLQISVTELRMFYEKEIEEALQEKIDHKELLVKKGGFQGYGFNESMDKRIYFSGEEAEKLFNFIESGVKFLQGNDEFKGTCASSGKATGIARIVPSPNDNHRVKEGDILITSATTVDYLPAMKKAAAIVTEVGGLTCHAAVVSREFGIPCVVALKNAMKNFKDGEMVEVEADKGLVRKVS